MTDPIPLKYRGRMNALARGLDKALNGKAPPKKVGFVLLTFEFGIEDGSGRVSYISNADRRDMIVAMKEWLARAEGRLVEPKTPQ
jgi:hypothetical protein